MTNWLETIDKPADLRKLTSDQLEQLAREIRRYLVTSVAKTGGHLGPNLGVVELSIALHRVFDCPKDSLIFDTGHQSYVHKLLTGRRDFSTLRQEDGLSGYPSRAESPCDIMENSHASTSLAWADGISRANDLLGRDGHVIAVIGDGALTGGLAWEALNNISSSEKRRLIIVVNDNGRSYAPTIGGLAHHLDALRVNPQYNRFLEWGKQTLQAHGKLGQLAYETLHGVKTGIKDIVAPQAMFEDLGIKYIGPVDGHDITALEFAFSRVKNTNEPVIVHVITKKGHGYSPAEDNEADRFHSVGPIHPETGLPIDPQRFEWSAVFADEIVHLARRQKDIVGITAAMMEPVGLLPFKQAFPDRVFDVGIAEQEAVAAAAGMAYAGLHPVFAVYSTFLNRAYDQILLDAALHHAGITIVEDRAGITGSDGPSHNGMWDIAMLSTVPTLRLAAPRDEATLRDELGEAVLIDNAPTVLRYPKGSLPAPISALERIGSFDLLYRSETSPSSQTGPGAPTSDTPGASNPAGPGAQPTSRERLIILATGAFAGTGIEVGKNLAGEFALEVIDPRWLLPVAGDLVEYLAPADWVVTLEDGLVEGGFGAGVRQALVKAGYYQPVLTFGVPREFLPHATRDSLLKQIGLTPEQITNSILRATYSRRSAV